MSETGLKSISAAIVVASGCFIIGLANVSGSQDSAFTTGLIGFGVVVVGIYEWRQILKLP